LHKRVSSSLYGFYNEPGAVIGEEEVKRRFRKSLNYEIMQAKNLVYLNQKEKKIEEVEVQAIRIGNSAIVSLPGEVFVEFGLKIKRNSKFKPTLVIELSNSEVGYIPTKEAFSQTTGQEQRISRYNRLAPEAGDLITNTAIKLLKELKD